MIIGIAGSAGAGKDTFADRLVDAHGFVKRGFAAPLYEEVAHAFRVTVDWLKDRSRKELPQPELRLTKCCDGRFVSLMAGMGHNSLAHRSPRWVLEHWGTDYRRLSNERYWLDRMAEYANDAFSEGVRGLAIPDVRFRNEAEWIRAAGGRVVQITRPGLKKVSGHVSALPLAAQLVDEQVSNVGPISHLHGVADSLIRGDTATAAA